MTVLCYTKARPQYSLACVELERNRKGKKEEEEKNWVLTTFVSALNPSAAECPPWPQPHCFPGHGCPHSKTPQDIGAAVPSRDRVIQQNNQNFFFGKLGIKITPRG